MDFLRDQGATAFLVSAICLIVPLLLFLFFVRDEKKMQARNNDDSH